MTLHHGTGLPGEFICYRTGFDGYEPIEIVKRAARMSELQRRAAVGINTYFPDIAGGSYLNRALIGLVQDMLAGNRLWLVRREAWTDEGIVPVEVSGAVEEHEDYVVATEEQQPIGAVVMWQMVGHPGPEYPVDGFYTFAEDYMILDFLLPHDVVQSLGPGLRAACAQAGVEFREFPPAPQDKPARTFSRWPWRPGPVW